MADGELRGGDDVRGRRVDDHDAGRGGGRDVDVVEPDARARDDLELRGRGDRLGVDLRRGADQHGAGLGERGEERGPVGAVDIADVEVGPQGVDGGGREFFGDHDDRLGHRRSAFRKEGPAERGQKQHNSSGGLKSAPTA
ncbi:hypothetical protein GCM10025866_20200 [Naasia aerilata]|uniref:Uncharacterized protein n=1 Tax=Naasia aerilata TaxID=1162966 RepID=A0ABN6XR15_9MICO|nr:hypothetical protein GCM10025866_20200 [Naasia aerilata]